ncbi:MAG TPA: PAS domain-containing sensor histidine kinase, partial [Gemmatimonadaceae bacterium]|nr:PAS domain-containing sensor histidine kinase [Gemmatimonadaceae bacterium]
AAESGILEANDEMLRIAGLSREEFNADGFDWQAATSEEDLVKDRKGLQEILERGACTPFEKEFIRSDGSRVPILVGGALLERDPLKWIAFALDLTKRRHAEQERDRLLEEAWAARQMAETALHARDALLAKVSHELRTPLSANVGYASMMRDGIPEPLPPVHQENVQRMLSNQYRLLAMMDGLLDFARTTSGSARLDIESLDVDSLLADIETSVGPKLHAGINYTCIRCATALQVRADRLRAAQILINLVGNAIKFTPPNGRITVSAVGAEHVIDISVADTGVGIPSTHVSTIFEPFVQAESIVHGESSVRDQPRGFGLGLAISRELARAMHGDLTVESTVGSGSTFTLTLPRG